MVGVMQEEGPEGHVLVPTGGGGHGDARSFEYDDRLWLWPLPPEGMLEFVTAWPAVDIPETRMQLDATLLRSLAQQTRPIWG